VVGAGGRRARAVGEVGRRAADDPAGHRPRAGDLLVALPVAEVVAACPAVRAVPVRAPAATADAAGRAEGVSSRAVGADASSATRRAVRAEVVAVDVVAGLALTAGGAEARGVDLPPPACERAGRAGVHPVVDGAAELGVAVAAEGAAVTRRPHAATDGRVRADRAQQEAERRDGERRARQRGADDEAAPGGP